MKVIRFFILWRLSTQLHVAAVYPATCGGCLPSYMWRLSTQLHSLKLQTRRIPQKNPWPFFRLQVSLFFFRSTHVSIFSLYLSSRLQYRTNKITFLPANWNLSCLTISGQLFCGRNYFFISYSKFFRLLIIGVEGYCCTWPHLITHTYSVGLLWTSDRSVAETSTW